MSTDTAEREIKIVIADDHVFITNAVSAYLPKLGNNFSIASTVGDGEALLELMKHAPPDIVILDLDMPKLNGFGVLKKLTEEQLKRTKIIVFSAHYNEFYYKELVLLGAASYLPKNCTSEQFVAAINGVLKEGYHLDYDVSRRIIFDFIKENKKQVLISEKVLSEREIEIVTLLADGHLYKEIAEQLEVTVHTVKFHIKNIYRKTNLNNNAALIKYAIRVGIADVGETFNPVLRGVKRQGEDDTIL